MDDTNTKLITLSRDSEDRQKLINYKIKITIYRTKIKIIVFVLDFLFVSVNIMLCYKFIKRGGKLMYKVNANYPNLEAELVRIGLTKKELAESLKINPNTLYNKLNGKSKLTLDEARLIKLLVEKRAGQPISFLRLFSITE